MVKSREQKQSFFQKKAFIFTFMSFFFVASVFIYVQTQQLEIQSQQVDSEVLRVERISSYIVSLEEDYLPLLAKITTKRAIESMINESLTQNYSVAKVEGITDFTFRLVSSGTGTKDTYFTDFSKSGFICNNFSRDLIGINVSLNPVETI